MSFIHWWIISWIATFRQQISTRKMITRLFYFIFPFGLKPKLLKSYLILKDM